MKTYTISYLASPEGTKKTCEEHGFRLETVVKNHMERTIAKVSFQGKESVIAAFNTWYCMDENLTFYSMEG